MLCLRTERRATGWGLRCYESVLQMGLWLRKSAEKGVWWYQAIADYFDHATMFGFPLVKQVLTAARVFVR